MNKLQHKLQQYEVPPPAGVWEKIAASLDESEMTHAFPSTLYGIEVSPPAGTWNRIKDSLDTENIASEPERRRFIPLFRYVAAAAILAFIILAGIKIFNGKARETGKEITSTAPVVEKTTPVNVEANASQPVVTTPSASDEARETAALEDSKHTLASLDMSVTNRIRQKTRNYISEPLALSGFSTELNPEHTYQELHCTEVNQPSVTFSDRRENLANRYIMLMTPDGNIIRMSKKWSNLLCCVSGEEQDEDCKDQLKKWRERLAGSVVAPSAGNFMDILNLVNSLQENNNH